jgi:hypothetical protein
MKEKENAGKKVRNETSLYLSSSLIALFPHIYKDTSSSIALASERDNILCVCVCIHMQVLARRHACRVQ